MEREERVSLAAYRCLYADAVEFDGVTVLRANEAPLSPMLNQIVGLGVDRPATEDLVDAALAAIGDDVTCYVAVAAGAHPAQLVDWLRERGLEPGWGWMSFRRAPDDAPASATSLTVQRVGHAEADAFGRIVAAAYGLPDAAVGWCAGAHLLGWDCWLALDGDAPAAAAGLYVSEGVGYLGFAATLPEHRGKGGQGALLATRIRHARERGCDVLATETGERREGLPSNSYRNILRAGFGEVAVRANWLRTGRVTQTP
jgi:GNAT superfamily N-acetyltransferase